MVVVVVVLRRLASGGLGLQGGGLGPFKGGKSPKSNINIEALCAAPPECLPTARAKCY